MTDWIKVQGAKPLEIDKDSSQIYVYVRRNINQITIDSGNADGSTIVFYEYEEKKMTKDEYSIYINEIEQLKLEISTLTQTQFEQDELILGNDFQLLCIKENITGV